MVDGLGSLGGTSLNEIATRVEEVPSHVFARPGSARRLIHRRRSQGAQGRFQARKVRKEAIPQWAEGLHYNRGLFSEVLVYYDDEALYFESRGKDGGVVRFTFEMLETLTTVIAEEQEEQEGSPE